MGSLKRSVSSVSEDPLLSEVESEQEVKVPKVEKKGDGVLVPETPTPSDCSPFTSQESQNSDSVLERVKAILKSVEQYNTEKSSQTREDMFRVIGSDVIDNSASGFNYSQLSTSGFLTKPNILKFVEANLDEVPFDLEEILHDSGALERLLNLAIDSYEKKSPEIRECLDRSIWDYERRGKNTLVWYDKIKRALASSKKSMHSYAKLIGEKMGLFKVWSNNLPRFTPFANPADFPFSFKMQQEGLKRLKSNLESDSLKLEKIYEHLCRMVEGKKWDDEDFACEILHMFNKVSGELDLLRVLLSQKHIGPITNSLKDCMKLEKQSVPLCELNAEFHDVIQDFLDSCTSPQAVEALNSRMDRDKLGEVVKWMTDHFKEYDRRCSVIWNSAVIAKGVMTEQVVNFMVKFAAEGDVEALDELIPKIEKMRKDAEWSNALANRYAVVLSRSPGTNLRYVSEKLKELSKIEGFIIVNNEKLVQAVDWFKFILSMLEDRIEILNQKSQVQVSIEGDLRCFEEMPVYTAEDIMDRFFFPHSHPEILESIMLSPHAKSLMSLVEKSFDETKEISQEDHRVEDLQETIENPFEQEELPDTPLPDEMVREGGGAFQDDLDVLLIRSTPALLPGI